SPFSTPTIFASPLIADDTLIIHIREPLHNSAQSHYVIGQISHGFKDIGLGGSRLRSSDCHININCPEAAEWSMQKNSVCRLLIRGMRYCTGTLVNTTANNSIPYILTANHCIQTEAEALSTVFYFKYEYPDCNNIGSPPTNFNISGSELIATGKDKRLDFTLVRMSQTPPASFNVYYSGWDIDSPHSAGGSCIHHPSGTPKRLAISDENIQTSSFTGSNTNFIRNSHWRVPEWSQGTTEGGSSGSALLNASKQIIGTLTGGQSSCENPINDYFSKFSFAWDYYTEPQYQLKTWLDPINSGQTSCNGFSPKFTIDSIPVFSPQTTMLTVSSSDVRNWSGTNEMNMRCFANSVDLNNQSVIGLTAGIHTVGDERGTTSFFVWNEDFSQILYEREVDNSQLHANAANTIYFPKPIVLTKKFNIGVCYNQPDHFTGGSLFLIDDTSPTIDASFYNNKQWTAYRSMNLNYNLALQPLITFAQDTTNSYYPTLFYYSLQQQQSITIPDNIICKIFPQPASEQCYVQFLNTWYQRIDCAIIDLNGSLVWSNSIENTNGVHAIPLNNLIGGTYLLRITVAGITQHFKIIKTPQ
ncbi:MAG: T9SS type A sorting domain-containing protein, partial [Bacteroidales bacterium]|nr:T9SS type A sorting domain-containing protein [Bacteroidales bacterium]